MGCAIAVPEKQGILPERAFSSARIQRSTPTLPRRRVSRAHPPRRRCGRKARKCPESARPLAAEQLSSRGAVALFYPAPRWLCRASIELTRTSRGLHTHTRPRVRSRCERIMRGTRSGRPLAGRIFTDRRLRFAVACPPYAPPRAYSLHSSNFSPRVSPTPPPPSQVQDRES